MPQYNILATLLLMVVVATRATPLERSRKCKSRHEYEGYQVIEVSIIPAHYDKVVETLHDLKNKDKIELLTTSGHKDFVLGYKVVILVSPQSLPEVERELKQRTARIKHVHKIGEATTTHASVMNNPVEEAMVKSSTSHQDPGPFGFTAYHTLESIYSHLDTLASSYPDSVEVFDLAGETYEGRVIRAVRITSNVTSEESRERPLIWLDGGIHSREWVSPATVMFLAESLSSDDTTEMTQLRERFQFVLAPVINPDGYVYSRVDRNWRKNRKPSGCRFKLEDCDGECVIERCYGVDSNRNWDVHFGVLGSSTDPCDMSYPGEKPFDQECVRVVRDYLLEQRDLLTVFITYHSYSQLLLYPWGHKREEAEHDEYFARVGQAYVDAVNRSTGEEYRSHSIVHIYKDMFPSRWYDVSGSSIDWVYQSLGVVNSYGIELRDRGVQMFHLSTDEILPCGQESLAGLLAILDIVSETHV